MIKMIQYNSSLVYRSHHILLLYIIIEKMNIFYYNISFRFCIKLKSIVATDHL